MQNNRQHINWVAAAKKGNAKAFRHLYESYVDMVYNSTLSITEDREMTKDITQEAFITAYQNLSYLNTNNSFGAWIKKIAINISLRTMRQKIQFVPELESELEDVQDSNWYEELTFEDIQSVINDLPSGCRTVFILYALEDYTHQMIAEALEISTGTSKSQYSYAKKLLKKSLTKSIE